VSRFASLVVVPVAETEFEGNDPTIQENAMRVSAWFAVLFGFWCAIALGETWRGFLVDAKCYGALQRDQNPTDTLTAVDRDQGQMIRYCSPNTKTNSFAIVENDGHVGPLDENGDRKAVQLIRRIGKRPMQEVTVTGVREGRLIRTDSISVAQ
jgi:hypothetical protein